MPVERSSARFAVSLAYIDRADAVGGGLCQHGFDDGDILLDGATADTDSANHLTFSGERNSATHRTKSPRRDHTEWIERLRWLHQRKHVCSPHSNKCRRVGLPLGQLDREHRGSIHAVLKNDVSSEHR